MSQEDFNIDLHQFYQSFFQESEEHISNIESTLLRLEERPGDKELLNSIFRSAHTIKGTSASLGIMAISEFTHLLETLLDKLRNIEIQADSRIIGLVLESVDCIKNMMAELKDSGEISGGEAEGIRPKLEAALQMRNAERGMQNVKSETKTTIQTSIRNPQSEAVRSIERLFEINFQPDPLMMKKGMSPLNIFRGLAVLGEILTLTVDTTKIPTLEEMDPERLYLSWNILFVTKEKRKSIENVFKYVSNDNLVTLTQLSPAVELELPPPEEHDIEVREVREAMKKLDSTSPRLLGNILVADGVISEDELADALTEQQKHKKIGEILVEKAAISDDKLKDALKKQNIINRTDAPTIRVEVEKIDKLMNLVGELVITQSMIAQLAGNRPANDAFGVEGVIDQLGKNCRDLQESVMSLRMLPVGNVFNRFPRVVRDMSVERGKKATLLMTGEETELDKGVIEKIVDPLTHLIRNSVDHGIETPEERVGKGKTEAGKIRLTAFHSGGNVVITVGDDGRGLNKEKIVKKAEEKGLITDASGMTDHDIFNLIFLPGFSTADKVTEISGRGVGMDVVKRNVESIGGNISIDTEEGRYTLFTITIPLTLAIIEGLAVSVGKEVFIIPVMDIIESKRPKKDEIRHVKGEGEVLKLREHFVPLIRLYGQLGIEPKEKDPAKALVVVTRVDNRDYAILVDELIGQQQAVVKNIGEGFEVPGIAGATVLGNGDVALILDMPGIVKRMFK